jgi:hypothetical protein
MEQPGPAQGNERPEHDPQQGRIGHRDHDIAPAQRPQRLPAGAQEEEQVVGELSADGGLTPAGTAPAVNFDPVADLSAGVCASPG